MHRTIAPSRQNSSFTPCTGATRVLGVSLSLLALLTLAACEAIPAPTEKATTTATAGGAPEVLTLQEGDVVKVSFPGVPSMDTTQAVRQDGRISLTMLGEIFVAGKTTDALTKELLELYGPKLVSKEVMVTLVSSSFPVYVTGAVLRPGKISSDRPISAFDALMEAGGFDRAKADLRAVVVIRAEGGQTKRYTVNLQEVLDGAPSTPFPLKRGDTVYVPEKFTWF